MLINIKFSFSNDVLLIVQVASFSFVEGDLVLWRAMCIVRRHFVTYGPHCCTIYSFYLTQQHLAFVLILYGHIVHVLLSEINDYYYYYYD